MIFTGKKSVKSAFKEGEFYCFLQCMPPNILIVLTTDFLSVFSVEILVKSAFIQGKIRTFCQYNSLNFAVVFKCHSNVFLLENSVILHIGSKSHSYLQKEFLVSFVPVNFSSQFKRSGQGKIACSAEICSSTSKFTWLLCNLSIT